MKPTLTGVPAAFLPANEPGGRFPAEPVGELAMFAPGEVAVALVPVECPDELVTRVLLLEQADRAVAPPSTHSKAAAVRLDRHALGTFIYDPLRLSTISDRDLAESVTNKLGQSETLLVADGKWTVNARRQCKCQSDHDQ
jgi:hypothetical protein